jgi:hypothetical protein
MCRSAPTGTSDARKDATTWSTGNRRQRGRVMGRGGAKHVCVGVHAGACVRSHAHTQFKLTNEQLIKPCTLERQHTPTHSTPHKHTNTNTQQHTITQAHQHQHRHHHTIAMPPPALTHATLAKEDVHAVKPTHMCPKATLSEATSTSQQHIPRASRTRPCLTHCRRPPHRRQTTNPVPDVVSATW